MRLATCSHDANNADWTRAAMFLIKASVWLLVCSCNFLRTVSPCTSDLNFQSHIRLPRLPTKVRSVMLPYNTDKFRIFSPNWHWLLFFYHFKQLQKCIPNAIPKCQLANSLVGHLIEWNFSLKTHINLKRLLINSVTKIYISDGTDKRTRYWWQSFNSNFADQIPAW